MGMVVLVVDDEQKVLAVVERALREDGMETATAASGEEALRLIEEEEPVAVVLHLGLPDLSGREVLARLHRARPGLPVVVLTAEGAIDQVVECMKLGAVDYVQKPFEEHRLLASVRNARTQGLLRARADLLASSLRASAGLGAILGRSAAIARAKDLIARAAKSEATVLLQGESGTGKELAARAIHTEGPRASGPMVSVNCGAIPEGLIESELFGHEKGAFTGAIAARPGLIEQAQSGTIFLDEVSELRPELQTKLLRVIEDRRIRRVGATSVRTVDVRVIAATNRELRAEVARKAFREDLYYRLAVFPVRMPALRERREDILPLAEEFLRRFAAASRGPFAASRRRRAVRSRRTAGRATSVSSRTPSSAQPFSRRDRSSRSRASRTRSSALPLRACPPSPPRSAPPPTRRRSFLSRKRSAGSSDARSSSAAGTSTRRRSGSASGARRSTARSSATTSRGGPPPETLVSKRVSIRDFPKPSPCCGGRLRSGPPFARAAWSHSCLV